MDRVSANRNLQDAIHLYKNKDYHTSIRLLLPLHNLAPREPNILLFIALNYRYLNETERSIIFFEKLIKDHNHPGFLCAYANMLISIKSYVKSRSLLLESLEIDSQYFDSRYNLGRLEQEQARYEQAAYCYFEAYKIKPSDVGSCLGYGQSLNKLGKRHKAISFYNDFLRRSPADIKILYSLACLYDEESDYLSAEATLIQCVELLNRNREYSIKCSAMLLKIGQVSKACNILEGLLRDYPFDVVVHDELFKALWLNGKEEPFEHYFKAYDIEPGNILTLELAKKLIKNDELELALVKINPFNLENVQHTSGLIIKGHIERELGDFTSALETLDNISHEDQSLGSVLNEKAITYLCLNQLPEAILLADKLSNLYPEQQGGTALLAACLKLSGEHKSYNKICNYQKFVKFIPIHCLSGSDFNKKLSSELKKFHSAKRHPIEQSLRKGTQTEGQLFNKDTEIINELKAKLNVEITNFLNEVSISDASNSLENMTGTFSYSDSWSVILKEGGYHRNHFHSEGNFSACYYVDVPSSVDENGEGWLNLGQPELSRWLHFEADFCIKPVSGCMVIFPSYLWHGTNPILVGCNRATVAFDILINP